MSTSKRYCNLQLHFIKTLEYSVKDREVQPISGFSANCDKYLLTCSLEGPSNALGLSSVVQGMNVLQARGVGVPWCLQLVNPCGFDILFITTIYSCTCDRITRPFGPFLHLIYIF
jgi:hypothetical protein